jgi:hypothetical protein
VASELGGDQVLASVAYQAEDESFYNWQGEYLSFSENSIPESAQSSVLDELVEDIYWGRWNASESDPIVARFADGTLLNIEQPAYFALFTPYVPDPQRGGVASFIGQVDDFVASASGGTVSEVWSSFSVDFGTAVIEQGSLQVLESLGGNWTVSFDGSVLANGMVALQADQARYTSAQGASEAAQAQLTGGFVEQGAAYVGGFALESQLSDEWVNGQYYQQGDLVLPEDTNTTVTVE